MKNLNELSKKNLGRLREIVRLMMAGHGNRLAFSQLLPDFPKSRTSSFPIRTFEDQSPYLQEKVLSLTKEKQKRVKLRQRMEKAYEGGLTMMLALTVGDSFAAEMEDSETAGLLDAMLWRFIALKNEKALNIPFVQRTIQTKMEQCDARFFIKLGSKLKNAADAKQVCFNPIAFHMADYWTHANCPLWMMNNEAGSRFVEHLLGTSVSAENYAQIIKRYRHWLLRFGTFPIRGTKIHEDGSFMGFEFSRSVKFKITGTRIDEYGRFVGFRYDR